MWKRWITRSLKIFSHAAKICFCQNKFEKITALLFEEKPPIYPHLTKRAPLKNLLVPSKTPVIATKPTLLSFEILTSCSSTLRSQ